MTITFTYSTYNHIQGYKMHMVSSYGNMPFGWCPMADTDHWIQRLQNLGYTVEFME